MKLLSVGEAAAALGVSVNLVYGLCAARKIRHERHGLGRGRIKIPEDAIVEYRKQQTVEVAAPRASVPPPRRLRLRHLEVSSSG
jgi:excisionase family DNA binding protein